MELKYIKTGDYELPNLTLNDNKRGTINKYGKLRLDYLKEHKKALYQMKNYLKRIKKLTNLNG